ncbi:hypothetical protein [Limnothrix redekei]|uniref:Uncharacterized protein n=1 Tax=Limnothrix redekei LRLZ20PSL1 TaxID=3112953 RepID=A0ABW7CAH1_9CYAN
MPAGQEAGDRPEGANLHRNPTTSYPVLPRCGFGVAAGLGAIAAARACMGSVAINPTRT